MIKKYVIIGFIVGILTNVVGIILYITFLSSMNFMETLDDASKNNYLGKIISLGAILNFLPFFVFLNKDMPYHARGVVLASLCAAITIAFNLFF